MCHNNLIISTCGIHDEVFDKASSTAYVDKNNHDTSLTHLLEVVY